MAGFGGVDFSQLTNGDANPFMSRNTPPAAAPMAPAPPQMQPTGQGQMPGQQMQPPSWVNRMQQMSQGMRPGMGGGMGGGGMRPWGGMPQQPQRFGFDQNAAQMAAMSRLNPGGGAMPSIDGGSPAPPMVPSGVSQYQAPGGGAAPPPQMQNFNPASFATGGYNASAPSNSLGGGSPPSPSPMNRNQQGPQRYGYGQPATGAGSAF